MKPIIVVVSCWTIAVLAVVGCTSEEQTTTQEPPAKPKAAPSKKVEVGKNVYLEVQGEQRRVLIDAKVCLRQGMLEQFLTRKQTKEHEAILTADLDARHIHAALQAARAEPGSPVKFQPKYQPARGTVVKVLVEYLDKDQKLQRLPAQQWVRSIKSKKNLEIDWVFGGSVLIQDPFDKTKPPFYAANDGTVICVSNFESALLDLPIESTQANDDLFFEAHTERIPPEKTAVTVILEPVPPPAGKK